MESSALIRIARSIARTAGVVSSDYDEEFDAKSFAAGFAGKIANAVSAAISGFAVKGVSYSGNVKGCTSMVPAIQLMELDNVTAEYVDGRYLASFTMRYRQSMDDKNALVFEMKTVVSEGGNVIWEDISSYTVHVTSVSGEMVELRKFRNGFALQAIGGQDIGEFLVGNWIIDEFGIQKALKDSTNRAEIVRDNREFLKGCLGKMATTIGQKLANWEKNNNVVATIQGDMERQISDHERQMKESK